MGISNCDTHPLVNTALREQGRNHLLNIKHPPVPEITKTALIITLSFPTCNI